MEKYVGIFAMAVGSFFFGMLVGSLSAHITSGNIADQEHRLKMETVREFMRTHEVQVQCLSAHPVQCIECTHSDRGGV
jgi:hypothetical protein